MPAQKKETEQDALDFNIDDLNFDMDEEEDSRSKVKMQYEDVDSS